jgi:hypothetical protein
VARREGSGIVSPMPKKHIGKGTILTCRGTAEVAGDMGRNIGYRDKEGKCEPQHYSKDEGNIPAPHVGNDWLGWIYA